MPTRCPLCQGIVAVRLGLYVAISAVFGISLFALDGLPAAELRALPLRAIVGVDSGVGRCCQANAKGLRVGCGWGETSLGSGYA